MASGSHLPHVTFQKVSQVINPYGCQCTFIITNKFLMHIKNFLSSIVRTQLFILVMVKICLVSFVVKYSHWFRLISRVIIQPLLSIAGRRYSIPSFIYYDLEQVTFPSVSSRIAVCPLEFDKLVDKQLLFWSLPSVIRVRSLPVE